MKGIAKQLLTSCILLVFILGCVFAGFYVLDHPVSLPFSRQYYAVTLPPGTPIPAGTPVPTEVPASMVEPLSQVRTCEEAVSFIFAGVPESQELEALLKVLEGIEGRGVFLVSRSDLEKKQEGVARIAGAGHELGMLVQQGEFDNDLTAGLAALSEMEEQLHALGVQGKPVLMQYYGKADSFTRKLAGAGGYLLVQPGREMARVESSRSNNAAQVLQHEFPEDRGVLQRGELVLFRTGTFRAGSSVLPELVLKVATERNVYPVKSVRDILANEGACYTYPLPEKDILPQVKGKIHAGQLKEDLMEVASERYIGIDWVSNLGMLPGFNGSEVSKLDHRGRVKGADNQVFLTFDDWGTDVSITRLLRILRKYNAKATFFVRTQYVPINPNLLRGIAAEGHTIASHTCHQLPLSHDSNGKGFRYVEITDEEAVELGKDLDLAYNEMASIVGDMHHGNLPSLSTLFRPPTLAVSKKGMQVVFDHGHSYCVSGTYTTQDYKATSAESLMRSMAVHTSNGAILIMHMTENSAYTAEALEMYLKKMTKEHPEYRFVGLDEVLSDSQSRLSPF